MQSVALCQNRDSVALQLYRSGKVTKEAYYKTRPKTEIIAEGKRLVNELRDKLPYKFPIDYLMACSDHAILKEWVDYPGLLGLDTVSDPRVLESFNLLWHYQLYKYFSFDGKDTCLLLAQYVPGFIGFDLFKSDSGSWVFSDRIDFPKEGRFVFDTLNGGSMIRFYFPTWGTGDYENNMEIVDILHGRFQVAYRTFLAEESTDPWSPFPIRFLTTLRFADLNHDGYKDIIQKTTIDSMASITSDPSEEGAMEKDPAIKTLKRMRKIFLWDQSRAVFVKDVTHSL